MLRRYRELKVPLRSFRGLADLTVIGLLVVISSGAAVRLTGSGLGCPDWPQCHGEIIPELDTHVAIEFGNRVISGLVGLPILALFLFARKLVEPRPELVRIAKWMLIGVLAQGLLGGITVRLDLTWAAVVAHYLLALALLAGAVVVAWRARRPPGHEPPPDARLALMARALGVFGGIVLVMGTLATAAGPHSGGAGTGDVVDRLTVLGPETLRRLILYHGHMATALGLLTLLLWFLARRRGAARGVRRALAALALVIGVQGVAGLVQYHSDLPAEVVWFHASAAALTLVALVWVVMEAGARRATRSPHPAA